MIDAPKIIYVPSCWPYLLDLPFSSLPEGVGEGVLPLNAPVPCKNDYRHIQTGEVVVVLESDDQRYYLMVAMFGSGDTQALFADAQTIDSWAAAKSSTTFLAEDNRRVPVHLFASPDSKFWYDNENKYST